MNKNSDHYHEKYRKIGFNWYGDLPLKKTIELHSKIRVVRSFLHEGGKTYPQVFLEEYLYKLAG